MGFRERLCMKRSSNGERDSNCEETQNMNQENVENVDPSEPGRIKWASPTEFMLTCIGYSVGLGNVWRFPYLCYKSGGGAFLIPYMVMMALIGCPGLFLEYSFGQFWGIGGLTIFKKVCPLFQGIGICYMVLNGFVCIYYNVIIALSIHYLFRSFTKELPWGNCGNEWNTERCGDPVKPSLNGTNSTIAPSILSSLGNGTTELVNSAVSNTTYIFHNSTVNVTERVSPSKEYWERRLLAVTSSHSINNLGSIRWELCLCLLAAWVIVVIFVSRGIKSTGKVAYFTATFPYLMLTVLVVRGVTLRGASNGITFFVMPQWEKLLSPDIWFAAATQLFYSTNIGWGGMITMASYNERSHNCFRDAIVINFVSFCTSLYAGFAVFSIIGFMAAESGIEVENVIESGPELAFIVYPRALALMPLAPMWSALFFFMLFLLGIGSQMVGLETVMTGITDEFKIKVWWKRFLATIVVAICMFLCGLPQVTQGGMFVLSLIDHYAASFSVLVIAFLEFFIIYWIYGGAQFSGDIKIMLGSPPSVWWRVCWAILSPLVIVFIIIFRFVKYEGAKYGNYTYPAWADFIGWCIALASLIPILPIAIVKLLRSSGSNFLEKWKYITRPPSEREVKRPETVELKQTPLLEEAPGAMDA